MKMASDSLARMASRGVSLLSLAGITAAVLFIGAMLLIVVTEVIMRKLFNSSMFVAEQLAGYLVVGMACLGQAYTLKSGGHVSADVVSRRLSLRLQLTLSVALVAIALFYAVLLTIHSSRAAAASLAVHATDFAAWPAPLFWLQLLLPIGFGMLSLQLIAQGIAAVAALRHLGNATTGGRAEPGRTS